jgi:HD superfamily phosphohydrolase
MEFVRLAEKQVYRDVIHGYIHIEHQVIVDLIATKEFQRLKRIRQMGGIMQVFPTAEHSRFSHSLGAYEVARIIVESVDSIRQALNEEEIVTLYCAILLHDIGHGPFSHAFELVHPIRHEHYSINLVLGPSEVHDVLAKVDPSFPQKVASVIHKTHPNKILWQLISSQIDADRIDYLLRDGYFTGASYGFFDIKRLIRFMRAHEGELVFKEGGLSNIENMVLGRYYMYKQIYYHPNSLVYEVITSKLFKRFFELVQKQYPFKANYDLLLPLVSHKEISNEDYVALDDHSVYHYAKSMLKEEDAILKDLADRFLNRKLIHYQYLEKQEDVDRFMKHYRGDPYYYYCDKLTQIVYNKYGKNDSTPIKILMDNGKIKELSDVSVIVNALAIEKISNDGNYIVVYK